MENFVVSARKYRPSTFDTVVGQEHITTTLKNAIRNNHLAQAFLFCGPRGVGKTTCARILAKTINCQNLSSEIEACGTCESCKSFAANSSFNVHELDAASNNSVDDIRNLVDQVRYAPQTGKYKVYIIDEVHMLSNSAFNAFLKTLEEPPSYAIFILATTERHKIIPTILSRCQTFDFNRIQVEDISRHLANIASKESVTAEDEALHLIAQKADGALRDALSIFDQMVTFSGHQVTYKDVINNLHILDYDYYFKATDYLLDQALPSALLLFDEILKHGFDAHNFVVGLSEHFRSLMVCKDNATVQLLQVSDSVKKRYLQQANQAPLSFLLSGLNILSQCDINYKSSKNQRLHVELALMKLAYLGQAFNFASGATPLPLAEEKKKTTDPGLTNGHQPANGAPVAPANRPENAIALPKTETETETAISGAFAAEKAVTHVHEPEPISVAVPAHFHPHAAPPQPDKTQGVMPSLKSLPKLGKLKQIEQEVLAPVDAEPGEITTETEEATPGILNLVLLEQAWKDFAKKPELHPNEQFILSRPYQVSEQGEITLEIDNPVQINEFEKFREELLLHLRRKAGNNRIKIKLEVKEQDEGNRLYTSQDKFRHLIERYPSLQEISNKFGLDTTF